MFLIFMMKLIMDVFEVQIAYPEDLHDSHNEFPFSRKYFVLQLVKPKNLFVFDTGHTKWIKTKKLQIPKLRVEEVF